MDLCMRLARPAVFPLPSLSIRRKRLAVFSAVLLLSSLGLSGCREAATPEQAFHHGDYPAAMKAWSRQAREGDSVAQNYLGILYQLGLGVRPDADQAQQWYTLAARQGNPDAQRNLGTVYQFGLGLPQDNLLAYAWYYAAWQRGNPRALVYMSAMANQLTPNQLMKAKAMANGLLGQQPARAGPAGTPVETRPES
jgi:hypothetical protein